METTRKVIVIEGLEDAMFLLKIGNSEIVIFENSFLGKREDCFERKFMRGEEIFKN